MINYNDKINLISYFTDLFYSQVNTIYRSIELWNNTSKNDFFYTCKLTLGGIFCFCFFHLEKKKIYKLRLKYFTEIHRWFQKEFCLSPSRKLSAIHFFFLPIFFWLTLYTYKNILCQLLSRICNNQQINAIWTDINLEKKGILSVSTVMSGLKSDFTNTFY